MTQIIRWIRFFDRETGKLAGEIKLPPVALTPLRALFAVGPDNPMYDCFEIREAHRAYFEVLTARRFDFEQYDYLLVCDAVSLPK